MPRTDGLRLHPGAEARIDKEKIIMELVLNATYHAGTLVLEHELGKEKEGKMFRVVVLDEEPADRRKSRFLLASKRHAFSLPEGYRFDRDEIYGR